MGQVHRLTKRDLPEVQRLLDLRPIDNIVVSSRIHQHGVGFPGSGNEMIGYWEGKTLVSVLSESFSLHPINATSYALDAFSRCLEYRRCNSIVGVRDESIGLWSRLCERSFTQWASPRQIRDHQQVMALSFHPLIDPDPRVQLITTRHLDSYHKASIEMYTEEVGVAPINPHGSYRDHVATLMMKGCTFGVLDGSRVIFKADIVAGAGSICQVGGVWLTPELRGRGLSKPFMAGMVAHCLLRFTTISLYVNLFNTSAIHCYKGLGFTTVGEFATIMY